MSARWRRRRAKRRHADFCAEGRVETVASDGTTASEKTAASEGSAAGAGIAAGAMVAAAAPPFADAAGASRGSIAAWIAVG
ncbi:MAG: hypothetical protein ACRENE_26460, partial [Polyangiaceae bacterium]